MLKFETIALIKSLLICYRGKGIVPPLEQMVNNLI